MLKRTKVMLFRLFKRGGGGNGKRETGIVPPSQTLNGSNEEKSEMENENPS